MQADLNDPTSLPAALVGIHTVIDCSTARPEESTQKIDWNGKVALIQCAQVWLPLHCRTTLSACIHLFGGQKGIPGTAEERQLSDRSPSRSFKCCVILPNVLWSSQNSLALAGVREPSCCNFLSIRNVWKFAIYSRP